MYATNWTSSKIINVNLEWCNFCISSNIIDINFNISSNETEREIILFLDINPLMFDSILPSEGSVCVSTRTISSTCQAFLQSHYTVTTKQHQLRNSNTYNACHTFQHKISEMWSNFPDFFFSFRRSDPYLDVLWREEGTKSLAEDSPPPILHPTLAPLSQLWTPRLCRPQLVSTRPPELRQSRRGSKKTKQS